MKKLILPALGAVILCAAAFAQNDPPAAPPGGRDFGSETAKLSFNAVDRNKDSKITPDEARAINRIAANFAVADKNNDGSLSAAEFNAYFNKEKD